MHLAFSEGGVSGRLSAAHAKIPSHLPLSPSKAKLAPMASQTATARALSASDLSGYAPKSACVDGIHLTSQTLPISSPPRTPLCNLTNTSSTLRKRNLPAASNTRLTSTCSGHDRNQDATDSSFSTPAAAVADCASHPATLQETLQCCSKSTHTPELATQHMATQALLPSPPSSVVLTPNTPEISEAALNLRQLHADEACLSAEADSTDAESDDGVAPAGEIHLFLGPMFAGKSTNLLSKVRESIALGRSVATIKSHKDDRYANNFVVTHNGDREACYAVPTLRAFKDQVPEAYRECDVIAIDEGQFFTDLFEFCLQAADQDGKIVFISGLDGDFQRQKFGSVLDLIPFADTVTKLHSNCAFCSKKGLFSLRISADTRQEVVGGVDQYRPVCRQHYLQLHKTRSLVDEDKEPASK